MAESKNKTTITTYVEIELTIAGKPCPRPFRVANLGAHAIIRDPNEVDGRNAAAYGICEFEIDIPKTDSNVVEDIRNDRSKMINKAYPVVVRYLDPEKKIGKATTAAEVLFTSITDEYDRTRGPYIRLRGIPASIAG